MKKDVSMLWNVRAAMDSLTSLELARLEHAVERLLDGGIDKVAGVRQVRTAGVGGPTTYMMPVDDSLRLFFSISEDRIWMQDLIRQEFAGRVG